MQTTCDIGRGRPKVKAGLITAASGVRLIGAIFNPANVVNMGDDPTKKKADAKRVSKQPHEQAYQKRKAAGKTATKKKK
jgi:hypothetical protein